jgi:ribonuclease BN (tRNA processing enzyme)
MSFLYKCWEKKKELKDINITIQGDSVSARYSGFWIKQWKVMLDAGLQTAFVPEYIFITHSHSDHVEKLPMIIMNMKKCPQIFVPKGTKKFIEQYLYSHYRLACLRDNPNYFERLNIREVSDGDEIECLFNKKKVKVKVFKTDHTIKSVGYAFSCYKNKLKDEYKKIDKKEFKNLAKSGIKLSEEILINTLIYTGDTRGTIFGKNNINWNSYKYIITECTFIDQLTPESKQYAEEKGHNHMDNILNTIKVLDKPTFILVHWSARYDNEELIKYFKDNKFKIIPWI